MPFLLWEFTVALTLRMSVLDAQVGVAMSCYLNYITNDVYLLDFDECQERLCEDTCLNAFGSFECNCTPCDHVCTNTVGTFLCSCRDGYLLQSDRVTCLGQFHCGSLSSHE